MTAYYNEIDSYAAQWLRNLIKAGHIAPGDVDERSIVDVRADDLKNYIQCHFFAGIGGFSAACRLAGWPDDRAITTGGFPCQDISAAGAGAGLEGERSGLWNELHRLLGKIRPPIAFMENSPILVVRGLGRILGDLAEIGFDAEWDCISAGEIGAPHERERIYIVSYPHLQYGEAGLGIFPVDQTAVLAAHYRLSNSIWLEASRPAPSVVDGLSVHLVRRAATEGFGNAIVPQVVALPISAAREAIEQCRP